LFGDLQILTVNHHNNGEERLDMDMTFCQDGNNSISFANTHPVISPASDKWFSARVSTNEDAHTDTLFFTDHCSFASALSHSPFSRLLAFS